MFGSLDPEKIVMILVVALIVIGPQRLPKAARQLGTWWRSLIELRAKLEQEFREAVPDFKEAFPVEELPRIPRNSRAAVSGFMKDLLAGEPDSTTTEVNGSVAGLDDAAPASIEPPKGPVERRATADFAPFIDDPSMN